MHTCRQTDRQNADGWSQCARASACLFIHSFLDDGRRLDFDDLHVVDEVPKLLHLGLHVNAARLGQLLLLREHFIQLHLGQLAAHDIRDIRFDLLVRVGELVDGFVGVVLHHLNLHAHLDDHKHVVGRLGLASHVVLLDTRGDFPDGVTQAEIVAPEKMAPTIANVEKLSAALDRSQLVVVNASKA